MRVLIVDDEKHVRDAIRLLINWSEYGISELFEASDGDSAVKIMENEHPEIVFTDMMMPGKNGMELQAWIHDRSLRTKVIVISGHDDFEFVRHTIKYGGQDYLLKPIEPEKIREALSHAISSLDREEKAIAQNRMRSIEMNTIKPVYWDKMFSQLLAEPDYFQVAEEAFTTEFSLSRQTRECRVAVLSLNSLPEKIKRKFASGMDLLFFTLLNICNEYLRKGGRGFAFRYWNDSSEIVLLLWRDADTARALLENINDGIQVTLGGKADIGLGWPVPFPDGLATSFDQAKASLRQRNLLTRSGWIHKHTDKPVSAVSLRLADYEENLRFAVRGGSEEQIRATVNEWFHSAGKLAHISPELLEHWRQEFSMLRTRWLQEMLPNEPEEELGSEIPPFPETLNDEGHFTLDPWKEQLTKNLLRLASKVRKNRSRGESNVIADIERYIRTHYQREITLQEIADRFFLSREYISRRFKQEYQENLSDFLGRIRIDKAKEFLSHPNLRIAQVAEMVGYQDEKYFSKVFKKTVGLSPNEFRKQQPEKNML